MDLELRHSLQGLDSLTLSGGGRQVEFNLYEKRTLEVLATLWEKTAYHHRLTHILEWMGVPILQFAEDIVMMQELLWNLKPDVLVECGVAHGGSAIMYAAMMELAGKGRVIGVDVDIRPHTRENITRSPLSKRITLIEGNSVDPTVVAKVDGLIRAGESVVVALDSNHRRDHVKAELLAYKDLVSVGSYLVVMDTSSSYIHDVPSGNKEMIKDSALEAVQEFLSRSVEFSIDPHYNRLKITSNVCGFLKKSTTSSQR